MAAWMAGLIGALAGLLAGIGGAMLLRRDEQDLLTSTQTTNSTASTRKSKTASLMK